MRHGLQCAGMRGNGSKSDEFTRNTTLRNHVSRIDVMRHLQPESNVVPLVVVQTEWHTML
jgi:hypothetical protein